MSNRPKVRPGAAWLVATREYVENVRTKGFWFGALAMPFIFLLFALVPGLIERDSEAVYAVVDHSGWVLDEVRRVIVQADLEHFLAALDATEGSDDVDIVAELRVYVATPSDRAQFVADATKLIHTLVVEGGTVRSPSAFIERFADWWMREPGEVTEISSRVSFARFSEINALRAANADLNSLVDQDVILGYFVIPDDPVSTAAGARYVTRNLTNRDLQGWFENIVSDVVQKQRLREQDIDRDTAERIQAPIEFEAQQLTESGDEVAADAADTLAQWAPVGFVYLLWISIFSTTQMLLTNTLEEKSNKLVEVLLSSLTAIELMIGKIVGIAMTGMTLVGMWLLAFVGFIVGIPVLLDLSSTLDLSQLVRDPTYLVQFVIYYLLGFFFYASVLCGLGSVCNNLKEAQNMAMPVQFVLFVPLMVMVPIGRDPNGILAQVLSFLPPFTPFVMLNRAAFPPSWIVYVLTSALMLVSIWGALLFAARLFENGILMTGKPPKLRQIASMVRAKAFRW